MLASHSASAREIHSLLGQMESVAHLLPYGQAHKCLLQWHVKDRWSQATQSLDYHISLGPCFRQAVEQFLHAMVPLILPQPDFCLFTDASLVGWGTHLGNLCFRPAVCSMKQRTHKCSGTPSSLVSSEVWFFPHIDLFATRLNNQLLTLVSPFHDPLAWAVDAMSLFWEGMLSYAFPPIPLHLKILLKMEKDLLGHFW